MHTVASSTWSVHCCCCSLLKRRKKYSGVVANLELGERCTMEGPKVPSEARSAGAPRKWGLGRGAVAPRQYGGLGAMLPEKFSKNQPWNAYFSSFLQAEMVSSVLFFSCSFGEARLSNRRKPILAIAQSCNIVDTFLGRVPGRAVSGAKPPEAESFFCFWISQGRSHFSPHFKIS